MKIIFSVQSLFSEICSILEDLRDLHVSDQVMLVATKTLKNMGQLKCHRMIMTP